MTQMGACLITSGMSKHMHSAMLQLAIKHNSVGMANADKAHADKCTVQLAFDVACTATVLQAPISGRILQTASWLYCRDLPAAKFNKTMPDTLAGSLPCIVGLQEVVGQDLPAIAAGIGAVSAVHITPAGVPDMGIVFRGMVVATASADSARAVFMDLLTATVGVESSKIAHALFNRTQIVVLDPNAGVSLPRIAAVNMHLPSSFRAFKPLMVALALFADKLMVDGIRMVVTADANFRSCDDVEAARTALQVAPVTTNEARLTLVGAPRVMYKQRTSFQAQLHKLDVQAVVNDCIIHNLPAAGRISMLPDAGHTLPRHDFQTDHPTVVVEWDDLIAASSNQLSGLGTNYVEFMQSEYGSGVSAAEYQLAYEGFHNTYAGVTFDDVIGMINATAYTLCGQQLTTFLASRGIASGGGVLAHLPLLDLSMDKVCQPGRFNPIRLGALPMP